MGVSLHLCDKELVFVDSAIAAEAEPAKPVRVLDASKLNADGLQTFALENTGTDDFARGALAMLELLEATLGRPLNVCADSDPKAGAAESSESAS